MKTILLFTGICLLMIMLAAGCSSLPKQVEPQSLTFAHMKMKFAREAQKLQQYEKALLIYREAYDLFTLCDDSAGKIKAALSVARQYFYLDKPEESQQWLHRAAALIDSGLPQLEGAKTILLIEMAFEKEDYQKVIAVASGNPTPHPEWQGEILCYAVAAKSRLHMDYSADFQRVQAAAAQLQKRFKHRKMEDPEVLSFVYYYMGYIYSVEKNWPAARDHFEKAREIDGQLDNAYGLAKDLYSLGQCQEKLGAPAQAADSFRRAAEIYTLLQDEASANKARERAKALENQLP